MTRLKDGEREFLSQSDQAASADIDAQTSKAQSVAAPPEPEQVASSRPATELDLRGLPAPIALLRANYALSNLSSGETLTVATDPTPHTQLEFKTLAERTGHTLVDQTESADWVLHRIRHR